MARAPGAARESIAPAAFPYDAARLEKFIRGLPRRSRQWCGVEGGRVVRRESSSYAYALIGIVGAVALIALFITIRAIIPAPSAPSGNLFGQATDSAGTGEHVTYNGHQYPVVRVPEDGVGLQVTVSNTTATFTSPGGSITPFTLRVGESAVVHDPTGGVPEAQGAPADAVLLKTTTVTLMRIRPSGADIVLAPGTQACGGAADGMTPLCRGPDACCGGLCTQLPSCGGRPDGAVSTCGARQLYCCAGKLSTAACGTTTQTAGCSADDPAFSCRDPFATVLYGSTSTQPMQQRVGATLIGPGISSGALTCMDGTVRSFTEAPGNAGSVHQLAAMCGDLVGKSSYRAAFSVTYDSVARPVDYEDGCPVQRCLPAHPGVCPAFDQIVACLQGQTAQPTYGPSGCQTGAVCVPDQKNPSSRSCTTLVCPATAQASGRISAPVQTAAQAQLTGPEAPQ